MKETQQVETERGESWTFQAIFMIKILREKQRAVTEEERSVAGRRHQTGTDAASAP